MNYETCSANSDQGRRRDQTEPRQQLLKEFSYKQIQTLASFFTDLSRTTDLRDPTRPENWDRALAIMIPKHSQATTLDKHRTISLMNQIHKLYTKWLLILATPRLDSLISEHQMGFRQHRQASEAIFTLHCLTEVAQEWDQPLTLLRLDISKAFDRMRQSSILRMLMQSGLPPPLIFNLSRELIGTTIQPHIYGTTTPQPVSLARGAKQGAPESGMLFVSTINWMMQPLIPEWEAKNYGSPIGTHQLTHLLFVDDLVLVSPHPNSILHMLQDLKPKLAHIGLELNESKTSYITTSPTLASKLPGTNSNDKILGRTFKLQENTTQEITARLSAAWGKFHALRRILTAKTPLPHRLTILKACIGQSLLWGSESWHLTRRNLQRLRGTELKMLRAMIPPVPGSDSQSDPNFHENHKSHVREVLRKEGYIGFDRTWVRRFHGWAGHVARLDDNRWAKRALLYKNILWWRSQQSNPEGHRHSKRRGNNGKEHW